MAVTNGQVTLGNFASILGIVQGLAWFVMSMVCILYRNLDQSPESNDTEIERFDYRVYRLYIEKDADVPADVLVTPLVFYVFTCFYIVFVTVWLVVSIFQINVLRKQNVNVPILFKDWALVTTLVSAEDLIMTVLLGYDYHEYLGDEQDPLRQIDGYELVNVTVLPVLIIVARGFIIWIVNVFVALKLLHTAEQLRKSGDYNYEGTWGGIFPIFGTIPRVMVSPEPSLYSEHLDKVESKNTKWNVNLRTAMDNRTPPVSPFSPTTPSHSMKFFPATPTSPTHSLAPPSLRSYNGHSLFPPAPTSPNRSLAPQSPRSYNGQNFFPPTPSPNGQRDFFPDRSLSPSPVSPVSLSPTSPASQFYKGQQKFFPSRPSRNLQRSSSRNRH